MHVMHVIDSMHGGGAETSLLEVAPALTSRGVRTSIVTLLADDGALEDRVDALGLTRIRLKHRDPLGLTLELRNLILLRAPRSASYYIVVRESGGSDRGANSWYARRHDVGQPRLRTGTPSKLSLWGVERARGSRRRYVDCAAHDTLSCNIR